MCARRGARFSLAAIGFSCGILPVGLCPDNPNSDEAVRTPLTPSLCLCWNAIIPTRRMDIIHIKQQKTMEKQSKSDLIH